MSVVYFILVSNPWTTSGVYVQNEYVMDSYQKDDVFHLTEIKSAGMYLYPQCIEVRNVWSGCYLNDIKTSNVCESSLYSSEVQTLLNSTDLNKTNVMNEMDRLPLVVFPCILSWSNNNILYLNSKLYSDGTKHENNRKENMYKHP